MSASRPRNAMREKAYAANTPSPTLATAMITAMNRLLAANCPKETGFSVGCLMTCANAASDAPGGIRSSPSGRAMLRGSIAMLTIHMIGKSTVRAMKRQTSCRRNCRLSGSLRCPPVAATATGRVVVLGTAANPVVMTGSSRTIGSRREADLHPGLVAAGVKQDGPDAKLGSWRANLGSWSARRVGAHASNCAVAFATRLVTSVIASRMKN